MGAELRVSLYHIRQEHQPSQKCKTNKLGSLKNFQAHRARKMEKYVYYCALTKCILNLEVCQSLNLKFLFNQQCPRPHHLIQFDHSMEKLERQLNWPYSLQNKKRAHKTLQIKDSTRKSMHI